MRNKSTLLTKVPQKHLNDADFSKLVNVDPRLKDHLSNDSSESWREVRRWNKPYTVRFVNGSQTCVIARTKLDALKECRNPIDSITVELMSGDIKHLVVPKKFTNPNLSPKSGDKMGTNPKTPDVVCGVV